MEIYRTGQDNVTVELSDEEWHTIVASLGCMYSEYSDQLAYKLYTKGTSWNAAD